jgi:transcriptional regulator with GAF, ATPase, and Fis domain
MTTDTSSLEKRLHELEELQQLSRSLSSVLTVSETLGLIADYTLKFCGAERASIVLLSLPTGESVMTLARSSVPSETEIDHTVNSLVAGWVKEHQSSFVTDDIVEHLKIRKASDRWRKMGSAMALPLTANEAIIGVINLVNSRGGRLFSDDSLRIANTIAPLASRFIERAKIHESLTSDNQRLKAALTERYGLDSLIGASSQMSEVREKISLIASTNATVLIVGETGTGKELAARCIHYQSDRADKPFIPINCAAIPEALFESELFGHERGAYTGATEMMKGKFELANQGSIFLDEISETPIPLQTKLLRVLEDKIVCRVGSSAEQHVDVRVLAASSTELRQAVVDRKFSEALYHRLNVLPIHLPPLRGRVEDIPLLAKAFLHEFCGTRKSFAADALALLTELEWRGNVRELRNLTERASIFISSDQITAAHLRSIGIGSEGNAITGLESTFQRLLRDSDGRTDVLESIEKDLVKSALREAQGNVTRAARLLGIDRSALQRRLEKYSM